MRWIALALFVAIPASAQQVFLHRLNWSPVPEIVSGYKVYRSLNQAQWLVFAATTNTTYTFTNTAPGFYKYRVTAYNTFGESLPSNEVSAGMLTPSSPTNLTLQVIIPINP
jgi:predicted phage tail protein